MGPICLGNVSIDWSVDNLKKTGFTGYFYDFSVDYDPTALDDIKNIHKYLMKKNIYIMNTSVVIKKCFCISLCLSEKDY